jgi:hypothetical protein
MNSKKKINRKKNKKSKRIRGGKDKCALESLIFRGNTCGALKSKCNINHFKEKMEYYNFFKTEKNKNFIENYLKKFTLKFVGKDQKKIEDVIIMLECLPSVGNLHVIFYKIYKTNTSTDSENFLQFATLKETQKNENFLDPNITDEQKSSMYKEHISDISIKLVAEFIVEVIIESILTHEQIQKKKVNLEFKKQFETFIKNTDTNQEIEFGIKRGMQQSTNQTQPKFNIGNGIIMSHYIELRKLFIKKGVDTAPTSQKALIQKLYNERKVILKTDILNHYKKEKTQKIIENLHSIGIMDTQEESEKLIETMFGEKQSSSYLFIVIGLLIFALLIKFNVLAGVPITGSGTM